MPHEPRGSSTSVSRVFSGPDDLVVRLRSLDSLNSLQPAWRETTGDPTFRWASGCPTECEIGEVRPKARWVEHRSEANSTLPQNTQLAPGNWLRATGSGQLAPGNWLRATGFGQLASPTNLLGSPASPFLSSNLPRVPLDDGRVFRPGLDLGTIQRCEHHTGDLRDGPLIPFHLLHAIPICIDSESTPVLLVAL